MICMFELSGRGSLPFGLFRKVLDKAHTGFWAFPGSGKDFKREVSYKTAATVAQAAA